MIKTKNKYENTAQVLLLHKIYYKIESMQIFLYYSTNKEKNNNCAS